MTRGYRVSYVQFKLFRQSYIETMNTVVESYNHTWMMIPTVVFPLRLVMVVMVVMVVMII